MKFVTLTVIMSLLGTNMALVLNRKTGGAAVPLDVQEVACEMPRACDMSKYSDWYRVGSTCVKYFKTPLNFSMAEMECRSAAPSGHLVSVHNCMVNSDVLCLVKKHNPQNLRFWLGGFELFQSGQYMWTDGSKWDFEEWTPGEPISRWKNREDCVEMNWSHVGKWNDDTCSKKKGYMCAFKRSHSSLDGAV
ncbi:C-type lectin lectoxin-Thr1-like [Esox lucius]|uniref:C-type lectin domain-containing protein n=1 Tax=Esox lucius TaxID=8010 RepID=A0AAY5KSN9_ESOLU|nr:C-type lectin lectoxin-Thr1-like [Esox lucius]XP_012987316.2 C-type lectin lectoxin-Thr1-like [Esox lucius]XP_034147122.1 C-type lectin lectoxin-Thr1-like [Esox lucius]